VLGDLESIVLLVGDIERPGRKTPSPVATTPLTR
jgi:hypothetical protein